KTVTRAEPVPIQAPAVDFSIPLRELMSRGKAIAEEHRNPEVFGIHYLAALDEPFLSAFKRGGLSPDHVGDYIASLEADTGSGNTEPVISDEVFQAVSEAKKAVRQRDGAFVKVSDFLRGLLAIAGSSVVHFAGQHGL